MVQGQWLPIFFCLLACVYTHSADAQHWDYGPMGGGTAYFGDLNRQTSLRFFGPASGGFVRYNLDDRVAFRLAGIIGRIWGDDAYSNDYVYRTRNLRFFSPLTEGSLQVEFNFLPFYNTASNAHVQQFRFAPYLFAGFSVFYFNPMATYEGEKFALQPLGTEGQGYAQYADRSRYKRTSTSFLIGGGFKVRVLRSAGFFAEAGVRRTATDYLDDVSQRYADPLVMFYEGGPVALHFSDPSVAILGEPVGAPGKMRGDEARNDDFLVAVVGITATIRPYRCPFK